MRPSYYTGISINCLFVFKLGPVFAMLLPVKQSRLTNSINLSDSGNHILLVENLSWLACMANSPGMEWL